MRNLFLLIKWELLVQNRVNNIIKYLIIFFLFCTISTSLINSQEDIKKFGLVFSVICLLISLIGFASLIFKSDLQDGSLELLLSNFNSEKIILAKFFALLISSLTGIILVMPVIYIFFSLKLLEIIYLFISLCLLFILASSLVVLSSSMQSYFRANTNFLGTFIMPLLIPSVIITGLILQNNNINDNLKLVFIMIGINLIFLPILFFLSSYLIKNIYSI
ncbi:heme exporter protein CcmB [Rickettsia endosymbiont of Halotydeus destructor]|uniref:heme exporter protein CcmB n=1 Tax=Rickettsia endosymbiont of Halotydeus destructor TaxID=2996754 RepID=UPI003BB16A21